MPCDGIKAYFGKSSGVVEFLVSSCFENPLVKLSSISTDDVIMKFDIRRSDGNVIHLFSMSLTVGVK